MSATNSLPVASKNDAFAGGFADPVFQSQAVFRALMDGMAQPARMCEVNDAVAGPDGAPPLLSALALTLLDHDTPVCLGTSLMTGPFRPWLAFHTGAPLAATRLDAMFALFTRQDGFPGFEGFALGSDEYPDRSVTLIVEIEALSGGEVLVAAGPGIKGTTEFAPRGLPASFVADWLLNRQLYPRGIDLILVSGGQFLCLPRTTRLQKREG